MAAVVADTHAVLWYLLRSPRLSSDALTALRSATDSGDPIFLSAISLVEVQYLVERGRVPPQALRHLEAALDNPEAALVAVPLDRSVARSVARIPRRAIPDMPDRIIAATALHLGVPLVTADQAIRSAGIPTIW